MIVQLQCVMIGLVSQFVAGSDDCEWFAICINTFRVIHLDPNIHWGLSLIFLIAQFWNNFYIFFCNYLESAYLTSQLWAIWSTGLLANLIQLFNLLLRMASIAKRKFSAQLLHFCNPKISALWFKCQVPLHNIIRKSRKSLDVFLILANICNKDELTTIVN